MTPEVYGILTNAEVIAVNQDPRGRQGRKVRDTRVVGDIDEFGERVVALPGTGLGFVLRDVPDPGLADQLDEDTLAQLCTLWWQLAACSEMTFAPLESILPILPGR